jgi:hypothetical protein
MTPTETLDKITRRRILLESEVRELARLAAEIAERLAEAEIELAKTNTAERAAWKEWADGQP